MIISLWKLVLQKYTAYVSLLIHTPLILLFVYNEMLADYENEIETNIQCLACKIERMVKLE